MVTIGKIAVCAIFKNEAPYLIEWIAFHRVLGVDHFILFDNGSTDGGRQAIYGSSLRDCVSIIDWPSRPGQISAYQHCTENFAHVFEWLAFIDIDEFIHPLRDQNIRDLLARAGEHSAMLLQWMNFGPSGYRTRPHALVLEAYTSRMPIEHPTNRHVKSIVRSSSILGVGGCHISQLRGDPCNADGITIENEAIQAQAYHETAVINHYYTKSWEDWCNKVARGRASVPDDPALQRDRNWFEEYSEQSNIIDTRIQRFLPSLKVISSGIAAKSIDSLSTAGDP